jgi:hypothetical protein
MFGLESELKTRPVALKAALKLHNIVFWQQRAGASSQEQWCYGRKLSSSTLFLAFPGVPTLRRRQCNSEE